jgi:uncharacterized membrane-anchored protein YhcB (DUF1043 family)
MGYFVIDRSAGIAIIAGVILLFLLIVAYAIRLKRAKHAKNLTEQENQAIKERSIELEESYHSAISSLNELTGKYEELNKNRENMKKLAYTDYLTELPNRTAFTEM